MESTPGGLINGLGGGMPMVSGGAGATGSLDGLKIMNGVVAVTGEYVATIPLMGFTRVRGKLSPALMAVYRSRRGQNKQEDTGFNWKLNFNKRLIEQPNGDVIFEAADQRQWLYTLAGANTYNSPQAFYDQLRKIPGQGFTLRRKHGVVLTFDVNGRLSSIRDWSGNTTSFQRDGAGRLVSITDDLNRVNSLSYFTAGPSLGLLEKVTDFSGREWTLTYDANLDLETVTTPSVEYLDEQGQTLTAGKTTTYRYSSGFADDRLNHNLISCTDPRGNTYLTNHYDGNDRVISQQYGRGMLFFDYNPRRGQTHFIDRNSNLVTLFYKANLLPKAIRVYTNRDVRPDDPDFYETQFEHNSEGEVQQILWPRKNLVTFQRDNRGNVIETRRKTSLTADPSTDLVTTMAYESEFNRVIRMTKPIGNDPESTVFLKDAQTMLFYYSHEDIPSRLTADAQAQGVTVQLTKESPSFASIFQIFQTVANRIECSVWLPAPILSVAVALI